MSIDDELTRHVRAALADTPRVTEVKMFGGIGFMLAGKLVVAASDRGLLVRVGKEGESEDLDGRSVKSWARLARAFVETLPPKKLAARSKRKGRRT